MKVDAIFIKDESNRLGLNSFKALGPFFAVFKVIQTHWNQTFSVSLTEDLLNWDFIFKKIGSFVFTAATDGNHGKALAWTCKKLNQACVIYVPKHTSESRIKDIESFGAEVIVVDGSYDQAVRRCFKDAGLENRIVISDMSYPDYTEIPHWIMEAYLTLFNEIPDQLPKHVEAPDFVFIQGGVGGIAAAACHFFSKDIYKNTKIICVEPKSADCIMESAKQGELVKTTGDMHTIMACLNCDLPSFSALPILLKRCNAFISIDDTIARNAMRKLYNPSGNDKRIISGESGCAGFAAFLEIMSNPECDGIKKSLGINSNSVILCVNTEGNSDPVSFEQIIHNQSTDLSEQISH